VTSKTYKRIILHAGLHKTGTTSIQDNCLRHRNVLQEHGIVYPSFEFGGRRYANHSDPIAAAVTNQRSFYGAARRLKNFRSPDHASRVLGEQFRRILENPVADTLLLSAELVCDFREHDINALRRYLERYTHELDVIAMVRSPADSLVSVIQQRCRDGERSDPAEFSELVVNRYRRLREAFHDRLRVINFHEAIAHPQGLVGCFLEAVGVPGDAVATLEFSSANERVSMEAFLLMSAINRAFPRDREAEHGLVRQHRDMGVLHGLPGSPFRLTEPLSEEIERSLEEQRQWLEQELEMTLPAETRAVESGPLWQRETLAALESALNLLDDSRIRAVASATLVSESNRLVDEDPGTAAILEYIAARVTLSGEPSAELILQQLGADYFKFAALQLQEHSVELALPLMQLALQLRPGAAFIEERIQYYKARLQELE